MPVTRVVRNGKQPEKRIQAQYLLNVSVESAVVNTRRVGRFTRLHLLLAELDRAHGPQHQPNVEAPESCHQNCEEASQCLPEEEEKLVVLKADAIVNPRAMMIHL